MNHRMIAIEDSQVSQRHRHTAGKYDQQHTQDKRQLFCALMDRGVIFGMHIFVLDCVELR
jgi:hypothetical protein